MKLAMKGLSPQTSLYLQAAAKLYVETTLFQTVVRIIKRVI